MSKPPAKADLDASDLIGRRGALSKDAAKVIAPALFAIERRDGLLTPEAVLKEAKSERSPLHRFFIWDDAEAAHRQRVFAARVLIRSVSYRVKAVGDDIDNYTPAFVHVRAIEAPSTSQATAPTGYANLTRVMSSATLRQSMLQQAARELERWIRRYETLSALQDSMVTARELLEEVKAKK